MPYQDGTGPEGSGPTGRGLGPCGDGSVPHSHQAFGCGRGRRGRGGRRSGRGFRARMHGGAYLLNEPEVLQAEKVWLEKRLNAVNEALSAQAEA